MSRLVIPFRHSLFFLALPLVVLLAFSMCRGIAQEQSQSDVEETSPATSLGDEGAADVTNPTVEDVEAANQEENVVYPLVTLGVGIAVVLGLIIVGKVNAFIALITAAMIVSVMAPGDLSGKIARVAGAFGSAAGGIGVVIAMAAVIGKCMLDSGAADRVVRAFLRLFGQNKAPLALTGSGFVLAIPVFFDTVFYLLVPLARSLHRKTGQRYLLYILAIATGGAITHTLVPPTPGPLFMAANLGIDVGAMIAAGLVVALPAAIAGVIFSSICDRLMPTPMRAIGNIPEPEPLPDEKLPSLWISLAPVLLPVILISTSTALNTMADLEHRARFQVEHIRAWPAFRAALATGLEATEPTPAALIVEHPDFSEEARSAIAQSAELTDEQKQEVVDSLNEILQDKFFYKESAFIGVVINDVAESRLDQDRVRMRQADVERMNRALLESAFPNLISEHQWETPVREAANWSDIFGNANLALLISAVIAMGTLVRQRQLTRSELASVVETSLMSGGVIILITAAGGAFGAMLQQAEVGDAVQTVFGDALRGGNAGMAFLGLGFMLAVVLKVAQGSSTVAMIVGSSMMAAIIAGQNIGFNPVYLATAIGAGSLVGSWMNDSGFWIFAKMGGLTEVEALKSWTILLVVLGLVAFGITLLLAKVLPDPTVLISF